MESPLLRYGKLGGMKSVPPRGSGWVCMFFMKPPLKSNSTISNLETHRYRVVVLTSCHKAASTKLNH